MKSCQAGVAETPSNASVLSIRTTKRTRSHPVPMGWSSPTPHGLMYTARNLPLSSRSPSIGPNLPTMPNRTVKASQCSSHSSRPKANMPASVMNV